MATGTIIPETQPTPEEQSSASRRRWSRVRLLWEQRGFLYRAALVGLILSVLTAFLLPAEYESTTQLMPPEQKSSAAASIISLINLSQGPAAGGGAGGGANLGGIAGELLGGKNMGELSSLS